MGLSNEALRLANLGYRVFPLVEKTKKPYTEHGFQDATTDEDVICEWWSTWPNANVGVATEGLIVIDVDPHDDGTRNDWADDMERLSDLMMSAASMTPRGGSHFWFRLPNGFDVKCSAGKIAPHVDVRTNGGYVVAPPSFVDDDKSHGSYAWMPGFGLECHPKDLAEPPQWLLDLLSDAAPKKKAKQLSSDSEKIAAGNRNETLTSLAGYLRRAGFSEREMRAALQAANIERCQPPLESAEVDKIAWSVARYDADQLSTAVAEGWSTTDAARNKIVDPGSLPEELLNPGGYLQRIIEWNLATARKPQPELALAGALSLLATLTGRKIEDESATRTNLYCLGVADSGSGKEHARKANKAILAECGGTELLGPEGIGSHAGLVSALNHRRTLLFQLDEIGRFLRTVNNPGRSPHLFNIVTVLLKLYTSSNSIYIGDAYADLKKVVTIDQPHAVLYGTTVKSHLLESLDRASLEEGFVGRMLVFWSADEDPDPQAAKQERPPTNLASEAAWWLAYQPGGNLCGVNPSPRRMSATDEAKALLSELESAARVNAKRDSDAARIWTRTTEKAAKLAILHAVSEDREAAEIGSQSAHWACRLACHLTEQMEAVAERWISTGPFERNVKRLERLIADCGEAGIGLSQLIQKTRDMMPRERQDALNTLTASGAVAEERYQTGGRPGMRFITR